MFLGLALKLGWPCVPPRLAGIENTGRASDPMLSSMRLTIAIAFNINWAPYAWEIKPCAAAFWFEARARQITDTATVRWHHGIMSHVL